MRRFSALVLRAPFAIRAISPAEPIPFVSKLNEGVSISTAVSVPIPPSSAFSVRSFAVTIPPPSMLPLVAVSKMVSLASPNDALIFQPAPEVRSIVCASVPVFTPVRAVAEALDISVTLILPAKPEPFAVRLMLPPSRFVFRPSASERPMPPSATTVSTPVLDMIAVPPIS